MNITACILSILFILEVSLLVSAAIDRKKSEKEKQK